MKDKTRKPMVTMKLTPGKMFTDTDKFRERYKVALMVAIIEDERKCNIIKSEETERHKT